MKKHGPYKSSRKVSFAFSPRYVSARIPGISICRGSLGARVSKLRGNVRRRETRYLGQNVGSAMSRGVLGSEWQYTLGLITRNYRLLNLDIRHMCAFNQSNGASRAQPGAFRWFQSRPVLPSEPVTTIPARRLVRAITVTGGCYSIPACIYIYAYYVQPNSRDFPRVTFVWIRAGIARRKRERREETLFPALKSCM